MVQQHKRDLLLATLSSVHVQFLLVGAYSHNTWRAGVVGILSVLMHCRTGAADLRRTIPLRHHRHSLWLAAFRDHSRQCRRDGNEYE